MKFILMIVAMMSPVTLMSNLFKRQLQPLPGTPTSIMFTTTEPQSCATVVNGGDCYPLSQCSGASTLSSLGVYFVTPGFQICGWNSVTKEPYLCCIKIPDTTALASTTTITTISTTTTATTTATTTPEPPFECAKIEIPGFGDIRTRDEAALQLFPFLTILRGYNSSKYEFPYMAALQYGMDKKVFCGASIISRRSLLTAAHCITGVGPNAKIIAVIGDYILGNSLENSYPIEVEVEKTIVHPDFNTSQVYNDLAILILKTSLNFSESIAPVCLPSKQLVNETFVGVQSVVTGWGLNESNGIPQNTLQYAIIPVTTQQECQNAYAIKSGPSTKLPNGITIDIICAGLYNDTRKDTCKGDSGGPLVAADPNNPSQWIQIGVVSAGPDCGLAYPGLYSRTTEYLDWIAANTVP